MAYLFLFSYYFPSDYNTIFICNNILLSYLNNSTRSIKQSKKCKIILTILNTIKSIIVIILAKGDKNNEY